MATNITYQKARRVRDTSFTDLLSDQLAGDTTIRGAIRKTISLKSQAQIKGLKEKFDPLNIAKFLTGGSSLGPALFGKLTGRSEKDIQYFSGRMRPIRDRGTASRIGREPGTGMSEGVNEMLRKIYYLMQITRETDLQRSEREANFAEEKKLEDEKRHKELLSVLSKLNKGQVTASEQKDVRSFLDDLMNLLSKIPGIRMPVRIGRAGALARTVLSGLSRVAISFISSPAFTIAAAPALLAFMASKEKEAIDADPFNPKYDNNPYALSLRKNTTAGQEAKKNTAKASTQQDTARRGEIQMALDSKTPEDILKERYGADEKTLRIWLANPKNQLWIKPSVTPPSAAPGQTTPPAAPAAPAEPAPAAPAIVPPAAPATPEERTVVAPDSTPSMVAPKLASASNNLGLLPDSPPAVPGTNLGTRLSGAMAENLNSNLPQSTSRQSSVVNNVSTGQVRQMPQNTPELDTIAVRNIDPTFMRLIMDNTRVV